MSEETIKFEESILSKNDDLRKRVIDLQRKLAASEKVAEERRVALEGLEWTHETDTDGTYCFVCGNSKSEGHAADCELARLAKK